MFRQNFGQIVPKNVLVNRGYILGQYCGACGPAGGGMVRVIPPSSEITVGSACADPINFFVGWPNFKLKFQIRGGKFFYEVKLEFSSQPSGSTNLKFFELKHFGILFS